MTVADETYREDYVGDGATTNFPVSFYFLEDSHLDVILVQTDGTEVLQVLNTDYTVTGAGNELGGTVIMVTPPASGENLVIIRDVPFTQLTDYAENDPFPAELHEVSLDKLTMIAQQLQEVQDRSAKSTPGGDPPPSILGSNSQEIAQYDGLGNIKASGKTIAEVGVLAESKVWTAGQYFAEVLANSTAELDPWNWATQQNVRVWVGQNWTVPNPINSFDGMQATIKIVQTAGYIIAWSSLYDFGDRPPAQLPPDPNDFIIVTCYQSGGIIYAVETIRVEV